MSVTGLENGVAKRHGRLKSGGAHPVSKVVSRRKAKPPIGAFKPERQNENEGVGLFEEGEAMLEVKAERCAGIDVGKKTLLVSRKTTKTDAGERVIPLNRAAIWALGKIWDRATSHGEVMPEHYVFCGFENWEYKPAQPMKTWRTPGGVLKKVKPPGFRFHDLRHSAITAFAESGHGDQVIMSIAGHVSRKMLEHYSHIRMQAKRTALEAISGKDTLQDPAITAKETAEKQQVSVN